MHESFHDGISSRVVTTCGDLLNSEIVVHCCHDPAHELGCVVAPELERNPFDEDESREKSSRHVFLLAIGKEPEANFTSHKVYRDQDLAFSVSMEVDTIFLSGQWELVCIRLGEFKAKPLQPHPADLAVVTRHDDPLDEVVHLVPIIALGERSSHSFWSDVKQGEMLLFDEPLSLFCRNDDSLTPLIIFNDQKSVGESGW
jgi:hypothetical protein